MINYTIKNTDYVEFKKKKLARLSVTRAVSKGFLVRSGTCQMCNMDCKTSAHHVDYGKPLHVVWLCSKCHGIAHRSDSDLNPQNNKQTSTPTIWKESDTVTVSFSIPIKQFMVLKKECQEKKTNISTILRENVVKNYPIESSQLEFNFDKVEDVNPQNDKNENISSVDKNETILSKSEISTVSFLRRSGSDSMPRMEDKLYQFPFGNGGNATPLQRANVNR